MGVGAAAFAGGFLQGANHLYDINREREDEFVKRYDEQFRNAKQMYMERLLKLQDEDSKVDAYTPLVGGDRNAAAVAVRSGMTPDMASRLQDRTIAGQAIGMISPTLGNPTGPQAQPGQAPKPNIPIQTGAPQSSAPQIPSKPAMGPMPTPGQTMQQTMDQQDQQQQDQTQQQPQPGPQLPQQAQSPQPQPSAQPQPQPQPSAQPQPQPQPAPQRASGIPMAPPQQGQPQGLAQQMGALLTGYHNPSQLATRARTYESNISGASPQTVQSIMAGQMPQRTPVNPSQSYIVGPERMDLPKMIQEMIVKGYSKNPQKAINDLRNNDINGAASTIPTFHDQVDAKIKESLATRDHSGILNLASKASEAFYGANTGPLGQFQLFNQEDAALLAATQVRAIQYAETNRLQPGEAAEKAFVDVRAEHIYGKLVGASKQQGAKKGDGAKLLTDEIKLIGDPRLQAAVAQRINQYISGNQQQQ